MLPDAKLGMDGFHDIIIDNLMASAIWRSSHISPADITALRRRWQKCRVSDSGPGYCTVCDERVYTALDAHMIAFHLELAQ